MLSSSSDHCKIIRVLWEEFHLYSWLIKASNMRFDCIPARVPPSEPHLENSSLIVPSPNHEVFGLIQWPSLKQCCPLLPPLTHPPLGFHFHSHKPQTYRNLHLPLIPSILPHPSWGFNGPHSPMLSSSSTTELSSSIVSARRNPLSSSEVMRVDAVSVCVSSDRSPQESRLSSSRMVLPTFK